MKNKYEVYTFLVNEAGEYEYTTESEIIEGYKEAKERYEHLKRSNTDKHYEVEMIKIEGGD